MRKLFIATLIIIAAFTVSFAQGEATNTQQEMENPPNMGRAPREPNGIGRLDLRVVDEDGKPVKDAFAKLESTRTDGFFCESWATSNTYGVAVLPPIHMGTLKLKVKAKGYRTQEIEVATSALAEPVRVTLVRKK